MIKSSLLCGIILQLRKHSDCVLAQSYPMLCTLYPKTCLKLTYQEELSYWSALYQDIEQFEILNR